MNGFKAKTIFNTWMATSDFWNNGYDLIMSEKQALPQYSLVVDEDTKKPNKQNKKIGKKKKACPLNESFRCLMRICIISYAGIRTLRFHC